MTQNKFFEHIEQEFMKNGFRQTISEGVENILIVRLDAIGDHIVTSGFIREVRANFPRANITLVVSPLVYPIAEFCPYVNAVMTFDKKSCKDVSTTFELVGDFCRKNLWDKHFTIAFSPQWGSENFQSLVMMYLSGAQRRIGYGYYPYQSWLGAPPKGELSDLDEILLTDAIITPKEIVSECEKHLYLLSAVGLNINDVSNELWYSKADVFKTAQLLNELPPNRKKVVVGIGAGSNNRKYPIDKWALALRRIAERNVSFVIIGGASELNDAETLAKKLYGIPLLNLVNKTTLRETEAIISQMDYYVGNVSGVMHMAAAADIPLLTIYREAQDKENYLPGALSEFNRFPPWMTKCVILRPEHPLDDCAENAIYGWCRHSEAHCIAQVNPEEIIEGFAELERIANLPEE